jgi:SAM-dependent methyltransferase
MDSQSDFMDVCVVCHAEIEKFLPLWPGLKQCSNCGHIMADIDAKCLDISGIYDNNYFSGHEYCDYLGDQRVFKKQFKSRLKDVIKYQPNGDLIELGCAYGFFLDVARSSYNVHGFDIAEEPTRYAREILRLDARCEDFIDAKIEPESADIITMWDVIEHLPRPDLILSKAEKILKPGGFIFITTGDIGSILAKIRKQKWRLIHPPTHLHYFNQDTIIYLLGRSMLNTIEIKHVGSRRSLRQIAYSLLALGKEKPSRLYNIVANSTIGDLSFVLNTYDIMMITGQKSKKP